MSSITCTSRLHSVGVSEENQDILEVLQLTVEDFRSIIRSEEEEKKVKDILENLHYAKYMDMEAPSHRSTVNPKSMREMLDFSGSPLKQFNYFRYLSRKEQRIEKMLKVKEQKRMELERKHAEVPVGDPGRLFDENNRPIYLKWHNALFMHLTESYLDHLHDWKKRVAAMFGQKLVIDLSYEDDLNIRGAKYVADQLRRIYAANYLASEESFDLHLTNFDESSLTVQNLGQKFRDTLSCPKTMISVHHQKLTDVFPRERLVYLTNFRCAPYSVLNQDDIIVLPGFPEKITQERLAIAKARRDNIRIVNIPLHDHVIWMDGSSHMHPATMFKILLNYKSNGGHWREAITDIPSLANKIKTPEQIREEDKIRRFKMIKKRKVLRMQQEF